MAEESSGLDKIEADWVVVEVTDKATGEMFRRTLPIHYLETDNGVVLSGENLDGTVSKINFLSQSALAKLNDLFGKGPDSPRCE